MNPVLLKPEADTRSQVVVNGVVSRELTESPWRGRSTRLWPHVEAAYRSLAAEYDVVVVEGAGSPAELNLWADDIVNMRVAELAGAPVLLVADIDRGGAFAHLYGTWALLPPQWRSHIRGFLLNKFRGDAGLLAPAPAELQKATGVPTVGVVPWIEHALPDEEGPTLGAPSGRSRRVCIVGGPYASNLDEFVRLQRVADVGWARTPAALAGADLVVLPGSKHVPNDLAWARSSGMADAVISAAASGLPVLGICGGLQMLGGAIDDPAGVEGSAEGFGLLPVVTSYLPGKTTQRTTVRFGRLPPAWSWLDGRSFDGYEIHHGKTTVPDPLRRSSATVSAMPTATCWASTPTGCSRATRCWTPTPVSCRRPLITPSSNSPTSSMATSTSPGSRAASTSHCSLRDPPDRGALPGTPPAPWMVPEPRSVSQQSEWPRISGRVLPPPHYSPVRPGYKRALGL
jgi:adenosylcobyric acid synthase